MIVRLKKIEALSDTPVRLRYWRPMAMLRAGWGRLFAARSG